jgi:hypothetical protein
MASAFSPSQRIPTPVIRSVVALHIDSVGPLPICRPTARNWGHRVLRSDRPKCETHEGRLCPSGNVEHGGGGFDVPRLQEALMLCVGLDTHSKRIAPCVLSEPGKLGRRAQ